MFAYDILSLIFFFTDKRDLVLVYTCINDCPVRSLRVVPRRFLSRGLVVCCVLLRRCHVIETVWGESVSG